MTSAKCRRSHRQRIVPRHAEFLPATRIRGLFHLSFAGVPRRRTQRCGEGLKIQAVRRRHPQRLEELDKPHEAHYFEKEGHTLTRWQTHVLLMRGIEKFLARHLGGRDGGFDYVELAAEYL